MDQKPTKVDQAARPSLILIHGFRGSPLGLESIAQDLRAAGYDVHVPAIPPFAGTSELTQYTDHSYAEFIKSYIQEHNLQRPVLIGHSMGSILAAATAYLHPALVNRHVILLSPIVQRPALPFRLVSPLSAFTPRRITDYVSTRFLFVPHDHDLWKETLHLTHACSDDRPPRPGAIIAAAKFSTKYCISDFAPNPNWLIIAGEKDRLVGKHNIERFALEYHLRPQFIPDSGHLHNYEHPHETAQLILEFLENN